jgi:hypothetical protein
MGVAWGNHLDHLRWGASRRHALQERRWGWRGEIVSIASAGAQAGGMRYRSADGGGVGQSSRSTPLGRKPAACATALSDGVV